MLTLSLVVKSSQDEKATHYSEDDKHNYLQKELFIVVPIMVKDIKSNDKFSDL